MLRAVNGALLAVCARCGITRTVNDSRPIPDMCVDCRTAERWTQDPAASDALRGGEWVRRGLIRVWQPAVPANAPRCCDCGEPTGDRHRQVQRCRDCWKAAVHAAAQQRAELRAAAQAAAAARRAEEGKRRRAASAVRCRDCGAALTTRHRHVQRCRACWKTEQKHQAALRRQTQNTERHVVAICVHDGCLLAYDGEPCPACMLGTLSELSRTPEFV